jgi:hypothetical protein
MPGSRTGCGEQQGSMKCQQHAVTATHIAIAKLCTCTIFQSQRTAAHLLPQLHEVTSGGVHAPQAPLPPATQIATAKFCTITKTAAHLLPQLHEVSSQEMCMLFRPPCCHAHHICLHSPKPALLLLAQPAVPDVGQVRNPTRCR